MSDLPPASALAGLDRDGLAQALRPLWENAGPLIDRLVGLDAADWTAHIDAAESAIAVMDDDERVVLLTAHPRLGTPPEALAARSPESWREQDGDRHADGTAAVLDRLNREYEERFGFPFVEWVAGRPLADIVPVLRFRLARDRSIELRAGCAALVAIARDRLSRLRSEPACP